MKKKLTLLFTSCVGAVSETICENTCGLSNNSRCDMKCACGTDCADCGPLSCDRDCQKDSIMCEQDSILWCCRHICGDKKYQCVGRWLDRLYLILIMTVLWLWCILTTLAFTRCKDDKHDGNFMGYGGGGDGGGGE